MAWTGHADSKMLEKYYKFNNKQKAAQMQKFNVISKVTTKTVFDYAITDAERAILDIMEKDEYIQQITLDKGKAKFDIARLLQRRGNTNELMECIQGLSVERMQEFFKLNGLSF